MRMSIVGKNPRAGGAECVIFGYVGRRSNTFAPIAPSMNAADGELRWNGPWEAREMRPGLGLTRVPALVSVNAEEVSCFTSGRLLLVSHSWSGVLQLNDLGRRFTIDLFSEDTRLILLDLTNEIVVDVTALAVAQNGVLKLPTITVDVIVQHISETAAWFQFVGPDANFNPGLVRRAIEFFRPRPDLRWKLRLLSLLAPAMTARQAIVPFAPVAPPPKSTDDVARLRDEMRLLAAAVEGLALRAAIEA